MQRYFVDNDNLLLSDEQIHHLTKVVRSHIGEEFEIVYAGTATRFLITSLSPLKYEAISKSLNDSELLVNLTLLYCLPKGEKLELVIQKATEIGVSEIILVRSSRCIMKIKKEDEEKKLMRYQKIALEASEQSHRLKVPVINKIIDFNDIGKYQFSKGYIAYENEDNFSFHEEVFKRSDSIGIIVGPEGGFSQDEVEFAEKNNYRSVTLGKRILRSETACIYALSVLSYLVEDL